MSPIFNIACQPTQNADRPACRAFCELAWTPESSQRTHREYRVGLRASVRVTSQGDPLTTRSASTEIWLAAGVRTPFAKVDGPLSGFDAIELSTPVVRHMVDQLRGGTPDFAVWGTVVPNLTWSNIAREVLMDAGVSPAIPAFSTVMAWPCRPPTSPGSRSTG